MENLLAIEMRKTQILINNPFYLGLSITNLSKTVIHGFCDYVKLQYGEYARFWYMDTDSFIVNVKTIN